jgi:cytoskeletal protein CcmA (bactofilin family)
MAVFKKTDTPTNYAINEGGEIKMTPSFIGKSVKIKGEIKSDGEILIEGTVQGKIDAKNHVVVEKNGKVNADINAVEIIIKGTVNGNVHGSGKVQIVPEGILNGNIVSRRVVLAEGAIFKGSIDMTIKEEKKEVAKPSTTKETPKKDQDTKTGT